jgi:hypothetical protein
MSDIDKTHLRNFFLHLLGFIALYWSMIALLTIVFQLVNHWFPDPLVWTDPSAGSMRFGIAGTIVAFPMFAGTMFYFRKRGIKSPNFPIYFTLFVTGLTAVIDVAVLIYRFTGGDITMRFILKMLSVLVITAVIFWFEMWLLKRESFELTVKSRSLIIAAYVIVLAAVVFGFIALGSPSSRRGVQLDIQRVENLRTMQYDVGNYYSLNDELPDSLSDLRSVHVDPKTKSSYEYNKLDDEKFELCATFDTVSDMNETYYMYGSTVASGADDFSHDTGRVCFERNVADLSVLMGFPLK